jgi:hypothetical protein
VQHAQGSGIKRSSAQRRNRGKASKAKVATMCFPGIISDIFDGLDDHSLSLLRQMGFEDFTKLNIFKTNKQLGAWMLSKFDPISSSLNAGTNFELKLTCHDVSLVLGIPWKGKDIVPAAQQEVATMKQYLCGVFQKESFDQININYLCSILDRVPGGKMTPMKFSNSRLSS